MTKRASKATKTTKSGPASQAARRRSTSGEGGASVPPASDRDRFIQLLRSYILKLDLAELDFGIYRILNYRKKEIEAFLQQRLPEHLTEILEREAARRTKDIRRALEEVSSSLRENAKSLGFEDAFDSEGELLEVLKSAPIGSEYIRLRGELLRAEVESAFEQTEEDALFNHLYIFFSRYYEGGDFVALPRRGKNARYLVPYNGEDLHFSWRGRNSHYIKTSEELRVYEATVKGCRLRFQLILAQLERDDVKVEKRVFVPIVDDAEVSDKDLNLPFEFRGLTETELKQVRKHLNASSESRVTATQMQEALIALAHEELVSRLPKGTDEDAVLLHLRRYARRNREDYFVHPNLGGFLRREFESYLLGEFLSVDVLSSPEALQDRFIKANALRGMAYEIIDLLSQIEDFQALLFEKARFVLEHEYLIRVDLIPDLWREILTNKAQLEQWGDWLQIKIGKSSSNLFEQYPGLLVDTRLFDRDFKYKALGAVDEIDGHLDGVLVKAESFGALRTLRAAFAGKCKTSYSDPPYNKGNDGFLYKDEFSRHSTWASMIEERLNAARPLVADDGVFVVSIDENEIQTLAPLMNESFTNFMGIVVVQTNPKGRGMDDNLATSHDYLLFAASSLDTELIGIPKSAKELAADYKLTDDSGELYRELELRNTHREFNRKTRPNLWYPLYVNPKTAEVETQKKAGWKQVYPVWPDGFEGCWSWQKSTAEDNLDLLVAREIGERGWVIFRKDYARSESGEVARKKPKTIWNEPEVQTEKGQALLDSMFGDRVFPSPKPLGLLKRVIQLSPSAAHWILDFLAGSGSTGHAVIELNRGDDSGRRFLLIEMGSHFDTVLVPRIVKASFSRDWSEGEPISGDAGQVGPGVPRLIKMVELESYDDSLNSLEFPEDQSEGVKAKQALYGTDFLIKYLLLEESKDSASLLNIDALENPFDYKLEIHTPDGVAPRHVDLPETFNLLLGVAVKSTTMAFDDDRRYLFIEGTVDDEEVLIIWRSLEDIDARRDKKFATSLYRVTHYDHVYVNGDSAIRSAESLDSLFKSLLLERMPL